MYYRLFQIATALLISWGTGPGAIEYPKDLERWVVTKAPDPWREVGEGVEPGDESFNIAQADDQHYWFVYLRAGRPSARLRSLDLKQA